MSIGYSTSTYLYFRSSASLEEVAGLKCAANLSSYSTFSLLRSISVAGYWFWLLVVLWGIRVPSEVLLLSSSRYVSLGGYGRRWVSAAIVTAFLCRATSVCLDPAPSGQQILLPLHFIGLGASHW